MNKLKILVVDDDSKITSLLHFILKRGGFHVCEENRAYAAHHTAREYNPDLIILDVDMPGRDGGEVAAAMADDPVLRDVPVIFLSSLVTPDDSGARNRYHYLSKPINPNLLLDTVRRLLPAVAA